MNLYFKAESYSLASVLIPFIAGMFLNCGTNSKSWNTGGLNPFYCRDVFEFSCCGRKSRQHCLNPFYCRDVFECKQNGETTWKSSLNPFYCRDVFESFVAKNERGITGLNPFYCRDVFEWSGTMTQLMFWSVLIPFIAGMFLNRPANVCEARLVVLIPFIAGMFLNE